MKSLMNFKIELISAFMLILSKLERVVIMYTSIKTFLMLLCCRTTDIWVVASRILCSHIYKLDFMMVFIVSYLTVMEPCY